MKHNTGVMLFIIVLIIGIVLFEFSFSFAYEAINQESVSTWSLRAIFDYTNCISEVKSDYTHRWAQHPFLTRSAIKLFEDYKGRDVFTDEKERLIIRGSIEEDIDVPPSLSMNKDDFPSCFDDPSDLCCYHLITTSFDKEVRDLYWYDHERCLNHFDPVPAIMAAIGGKRATEFAQIFKEDEIDTKNHFAWENIKKVDEKLQLIMLGHVLHLLVSFAALYTFPPFCFLSVLCKSL